MSKQQLIIYGFIGLAVYLISTGLSYAAFSLSTAKPRTIPSINQPTANDSQGHFVVDPSLPRTEVCPMNGKMYTEMERDIWKNRRPLAVMIENHEDSRPQSGLSKADVVYEAVAEGGITRFMGIFYCGIAAEKTLLAPVRSARTYYLPWVLEYDALYNHVGGAGLCNDPTVYSEAKALCQIDQWKIKDMDQFGISFPTCFRNYDRLDHPVATEHTMVCDSDKLYDVAKSRGWTNADEKNVPWDKNFVQWKFKDDAKDADRGASFSASFSAWSGYENDYGVKWVYSRASNTYERHNGGSLQKDLETDKVISASTVIIQYAKETGPVDEHMHLLYKNIGSGTGLVFIDGKVIDMNWKKADRSSRTMFYTKSGKEIELNRGTIWIEMLPIGTDISY